MYYEHIKAKDLSAAQQEVYLALEGLVRVCKKHGLSYGVSVDLGDDRSSLISFKTPTPTGCPFIYAMHAVAMCDSSEEEAYLISALREFVSDNKVSLSSGIDRIFH